jgi:hypothetical protein
MTKQEVKDKLKDFENYLGKKIPHKVVESVNGIMVSIDLAKVAEESIQDANRFNEIFNIWQKSKKSFIEFRALDDKDGSFFLSGNLRVNSASEDI